MASFVTRVELLVKTATDQGSLDSEAANALIALAERQERERGVLNLGRVLALLGGGVVVIGIILLVSANWQDISDGLKIVVFLILLAGTHGIGLWIRWTDRPYPRVAEATHFIGAGLFLAGVGLILQIYQLDARPPNAILFWLVAIVPLAVLLRSAPVTSLAIFALWLWLHMEGSYTGSPVEMSSFGSYLMLSMGIGIALLGFQTAIGSQEPLIRRAMRSLGVLLLFYSVYVLGFYRHFAALPADASLHSWILPSVVLSLGAIGLAVGWTRLVPESPWLRHRLAILLVLLLVIGAATVAADQGALPRGRDLEFFSFGSGIRHFDAVEWMISIAAWAVWFLLALWCVAYGTLRRQKEYMDIGVLGFGLGVVTRFFDLIGGLAETGTLFLGGGVILLVTAWAMERWRRSLVARIGSGATA